MEVLSMDNLFQPYIIRSDECTYRITSPECVAEESITPARDRKCKRVKTTVFNKFQNNQFNHIIHLQFKYLLEIDLYFTV